MRIDIRHKIRIDFGDAPRQPLLRLRLTPQGGAGRAIERWSLDLDNCVREVDYVDPYGNGVTLIRVQDGADSIAIVSSGAVMSDRASNGCSRPHTGFVPMWLFCQSTTLTRAGQEILRLCSRIRAARHDEDAEQLEALAQAVRHSVPYHGGRGPVAASAEEAFRLGKGDAADHSHVFIAAARSLGFPARYVSGYRKEGVQGNEATLHSWAEAYIEGRGWMGLDITNEVVPDERYVRLAVGRDHMDAAPIYSLAPAESDNRVAVSIQIQQ